MTPPSAVVAKRFLVAPEVVQTSTMDCGPAALKCLLEGFGISVSYPRLQVRRPAAFCKGLSAITAAWMLPA